MLGGSKVHRLQSRRRYSEERHGCAFEALGVQPAEYMPYKSVEECCRFATVENEHAHVRTNRL